MIRLYPQAQSYFRCISFPKEVISLLEEESQREEELSKADCYVVVLMLHDTEGGLYGKDGKTDALEELYALFNHENCPALQGKPKVFIVQACQRGG